MRDGLTYPTGLFEHNLPMTEVSIQLTDQSIDSLPPTVTPHNRKETEGHKAMSIKKNHILA